MPALIFAMLWAAFALFGDSIPGIRTLLNIAGEITSGAPAVEGVAHSVDPIATGALAGVCTLFIVLAWPDNEGDKPKGKKP